MVKNGRSKNNIVLDVQGIAKSYGSQEALTDLTFTVRAGEILGLLGPNGAGKTTAIRVLTTIFPASRGQYSVAGFPDSRPKEIRGVIGVVPESNGFPASMTGEGYLTYMGRLYGQSRPRAQEKAGDLLRLFGLAKVGSRRIVTYSRGMKQRLAIARALINEPKILFLDEPTLGFDPKGQREMLQVIREAAETDQVAVVLSSHLLEVVEAICQRVLILNHGRVIGEGSVDEIKKQVSLPHTCRIGTTAEAIPGALQILSSMTGVTVERHAEQAGELIVSIQNPPGEGTINEVLQQLILAGIPIESFSKDSVRLSDAFLSMIEEVQV